MHLQMRVNPWDKCLHANSAKYSSTRFANMSKTEKRDGNSKDRIELSGIIYEINVVQKVNSLPHERSTGSTSHGTFSVPFVLFRLSVSTNL